jgi:hypothetical protein
LHAGDIREASGEVASYHEKDYRAHFFWALGLWVFWPFFGLPSLSSWDGSGHGSCIGILFSLEKYAFFSIWITSRVQKSNSAAEPHDSAGLHCQAQKGLWPVLGGGDLFSILRNILVWQKQSASGKQSTCSFVKITWEAT